MKTKQREWLVLENDVVKKVICAFLLLLGSHAHAALGVFACEPEWAALAEQLAGDKANIYTATSALQDPHRVKVRPSLIAKARNAELLVCTGADVEIGWLPEVLRESGNNTIRPGSSSYFEAAQYVTLLEVPARLDRADGDVHAMGNPHIQTDPRNFLPIAEVLSERLVQLDPDNTTFYQQQLGKFQQSWRAAITKWEQQAEPLKGVAIVAHHNDFPYLNNWLGLKQVAELEHKPGVKPSAVHLGRVVNKLERDPAKMVLRAAYQDKRPSEWIQWQAYVTTVELPYTVGGTPQATDLFTLFDDTIRRLLKGLK
jgi:zinc/manganese transport system substrate-binding protein